MTKYNSVDVIEAYRQRQERSFPFTFADVSNALLFLFILASSIYISFAGGPKLPTLIELKTNTPTLTPSITPTPSSTPTITQTPTETLVPEVQCNCPSAEIRVVTATFDITNTSVVLPIATETATAIFTPTETPLPSATPTSTETLTATPSASPTPTQVLYTVQNKDTLGGIALRFGVSVESIQALNNLNSTMIYVGQVLQIPRP